MELVTKLWTLLLRGLVCHVVTLVNIGVVILIVTVQRLGAVTKCVGRMYCLHLQG